MYTIYVSFICHEGKREAFVERMKSEGVLAAVLAEDGCIRYDYYYSAADKDVLFLFEEWECEEKQQIHLGQPHIANIKAAKEKYIEESSMRPVR